VSKTYEIFEQTYVIFGVLLGYWGVGMYILQDCQDVHAIFISKHYKNSMYIFLLVSYKLIEKL